MNRKNRKKEALKMKRYFGLSKIPNAKQNNLNALWESLKAESEQEELANRQV